MKHYALALSATLISSLCAFGQPVLNETYHARIGTQFSFNEIGDSTSIVVPTTGANQTWNFSALTNMLSITGKVMAPAGGARAAQFPNATSRVNFSMMGISYDTYFFSVSSGFYVQGTASAFDYTRYAPAANYLPTSLGYGQSQSQSYLETTTELGSPALKYYQNEEATSYIGYGTLHLPNGATYGNVALLKTVYKGFDADAPAGPFTLTDSGTHYIWIAPGIGYPVLEMTIGASMKDNGTWGDDIRGSYMSDLVMGAKPTIKFEKAVLSPMPAHNHATIKLPADEEATTALVMDNTGRLVAELPLANNRLDLTRLMPGAYWVEVRGRKAYRATLIKE